MRKKSITKKNPSIGIVCTAPWRLTKVIPLTNYRLEVEFVDGTCGTVEMYHRIMSDKAGVFAKLQNTKLFNQVYLQYGAVTWPGEIDLAPDTMHDEIIHHGRWILN